MRQAMFRRGRRFYERIWPKCPAAGRRVVGIDATPAYHVWCHLVRVRVRVRDRVRIRIRDRLVQRARLHQVGA